MNTPIQQGIQATIPPLPSFEDAVRHSLPTYFQVTLDKVATFLGPGQHKSYSALTNEEIFHRGYFLHYIYQSLEVLHRISQLLKPPNLLFKNFLTGLFFTTQDYTKITRFNNTCIFQNGGLPPASQRILELLYETEFYAYQILLRLWMVKLVFEQHEQTSIEIEAINQRSSIFPQYFSNDRKLHAPKRDKLRLKQVFKEVQSMLGYYHCELSINRLECTSRPEINCLLHLLKRKFSNTLLEYVRQHINFKCEGELPPSKEKTQQKPTIPSPPQIPKEPLNEEIKPPPEDIHLQLFPSPLVEPQVNIPIPPSPQLPKIKKQPSEQQKESQKQHSPLKLIEFEALRTPKREKTAKYLSSNRYFEQKRQNSESASKISSDMIESNLPEFKYEKHHPATPSQKAHSKHSKQIQHHQQMKAITKSSRFPNAPCRFKFNKNKYKDRRREDRQIPVSLNRPLQLNAPIAPMSYFNPNFQRQQDESEESYLAEETPVHRNRTYIRSNNQH